MIKGEITRVVKKYEPDECLLYHDDVLKRLKFETMRLRTLKILWVLILIVSAVLYVTFR